MKLMTMRLVFGFSLLLAHTTQAQIAAGATKWLGNITTNGAVRSDFLQYWDQITAENECKWVSVERTRDVMNWRGCDAVYNYAKQNGIPTKFHTLVWGSQYPTWITSLSQSDQLAEITEWYDAAKARYPDLDMIDVVNEAVPGHAPAPFKNALGGDGATGYDWIITSFRMARERWPNALLIYNDYNVITWQRAEFITLMNKIKSSGYVDAMGFQAHGLEGVSARDLKTRIDEIYNSVRLPILISEYDINRASDTDQLNIMKAQFPVFWEHPQVAAVTIWGYVVGTTWRDNTGLLTSGGAERPALTWLKQYVAGKKNVASPINWGNMSAPKFTSPAAVSLQQNTASVTTLAVTAGGSVTFSIDGGPNASLFQLNGAALSFKQAPSYRMEGGSDVNIYQVTVKATSNGASTTQNMTITILPPPGPYGGTAISLPGKVEFEHFDVGGNGFAYFDNTPGSETSVAFRTTEDVDIEVSTDIGGGYNVGWAAAGEWLQYTVNVTSAGLYDLILRVACDGDGRLVSLAVNGTAVKSDIAIPNTGGWQTWQDVQVPSLQLGAGEQVLRVTIGAQSYVNLNYMTFQPNSPTALKQVRSPSSAPNLNSGRYNRFDLLGRKPF